MNLSCGIVGLPNVGKSTLFNALLSRQVADVANYPFCTIEPNVGIVEVPDLRLGILAEIEKSEKIVLSAIKFVDIAGLVKGASKGEGLGNKFLAHIREVDLIIHLVRAFDDSDVARAGSVDPRKDYEIISAELCLADLETLERQKEIKGAADKKEILRWQTILKLKKSLSEGIPVRNVALNEEEKGLIRDLCLITQKKELVVFNAAEQDLQDAQNIKNQYPDLKPLIISAKIEAELMALGEKEKKEYLKALNIQESGLEQLIKTAYRDLGLISFLTVGEKEARAWTIQKGTKAPEAAGAIHTDFEKGFIRAAVVKYDDFIKYNGWKGLREAGKIKFEGKDYEVEEGDIILFYHN